MATPPESLSDYALAALRRDLIEGRLVPGQRVAVDEIARALSISHIPVREALRALEAEGHVERDPRKQVRVRPTTAAEAEEIYGLRELLESDLLRFGVPVLTANDLEILNGEFRAMAEAVEEHDAAKYARANRVFHFVPYQRAQRPWSLRFISNLWDAAARYQTSLFRGAGWEQTLQDQHAAMLAAFRERDPAMVNRIMHEHRLVTVRVTRDREAKTITGAPE